jgi:hypothetical protein
VWPLSIDGATVTDTSRYGIARAHAWNQLHPRLTHRGSWTEHDGPLPILEGAIIQLQVQRLPGDRTPKPLWLWHSRPTITTSEVDRLWQAFLRRFDLEHMFRFLKQTLGWTRPRIRTPEQGDRWTWLIVAAHTQLRLARHLTADLRQPWEKPVTEPHRLTPARIRRGFAEPPPEDHPSGQCTETLTTWPRPPTRNQEQPTRSPPRRRQTRHQHHQHGPQDRLKLKVRARPGTPFPAARRPVRHLAALSEGPIQQRYRTLRGRQSQLMHPTPTPLATEVSSRTRSNNPGANLSQLGTALIAVLVTLGGTAVLTVPFWVRLSRDLGEERRGRIREAERSEIAAHLHCSAPGYARSWIPSPRTSR